MLYSYLSCPKTQNAKRNVLKRTPKRTPIRVVFSSQNAENAGWKRNNPTYKLKQSDLKFNFLIFQRVSIQERALRTSESDSPRETVPESRFIIRIRHLQASFVKDFWIEIAILLIRARGYSSCDFGEDGQANLIGNMCVDLRSCWDFLLLFLPGPMLTWLCVWVYFDQSKNSCSGPPL